MCEKEPLSLQCHTLINLCKNELGDKFSSKTQLKLYRYALVFRGHGLKKISVTIVQKLIE